MQTERREGVASLSFAISPLSPVPEEVTAIDATAIISGREGKGGKVAKHGNRAHGKTGKEGDYSQKGIFLYETLGSWRAGGRSGRKPA